MLLEKYSRAVSKAIPGAVVWNPPQGAYLTFYRNGKLILVKEFCIKNGFILSEESEPPTGPGCEDSIENNTQALIRYHDHLLEHVHTNDVTAGSVVITLRYSGPELLCSMWVPTNPTVE